MPCSIAAKLHQCSNGTSRLICSGWWSPTTGVVERVLGHVAVDAAAGRGVDSLRTYDAVSRDVVGRWAYPMTPDANALPRGERSTYAHAFANAYREKNVRVAASATVGPGTVLGEGCAIGERSSVEASTLGRGAVVGADCDVRGSYVQSNVTIHDGARVTSAFLCEDVVVHAGAVVGKGAVLSYGVVVGAGHVVADYARLSLATQPARDEAHMKNTVKLSTVKRMPGMI